MIFTSAYNSRVVNILDDGGQYKFYEDMVKMIRQVFPRESHDILVKPHPIERVELYRPLEQFGVKIFDRFADSFALVYFADLYIADSSTANFIPLAMNKKVILTDFFRLPLIEKTAPYFGIKHFVTDREEFVFLLEKHKKGNLDYQYKDREKIIVSDSLRKILDWIG